MIVQLLRWWYGPGWILAFRRISIRTHNVAASFSAPTLLKTLFAPWKRIQTAGARSLDAKFRAALDNLVSRMVGMATRLMVLFAALIMTTGTFIISAAIAVAWPLFPLLIVFFIMKGVA